MLHYDNHFGNIKGQKMVKQWEGPFFEEVCGSWPTYVPKLDANIKDDND